MNFSNTIAEIARKSMREREREREKISDVMEEGEKLNFSNKITEILAAPSSPVKCPRCYARWSARKGI